ncbi:MAG TPA: M20/M25/M40 family metallo-hydrolase [Acidimicrobiales bacterium]|jgi:acetylornithine deacetylase/succinyl-diaminopimelate desuccinylase-like protein
MASESGRTAEATDLLQHLIRNQCVNDGTAASGQEHRSAELLGDYLEGSGVDLETYEPEPGRTSLVAKIHGSDPSAPSLTLLGHTDVVPANADDWRHDPFGGELIDDVVWGRGAIDMLDLTATMATGLRHLALSGFRPAGDLTYVAVADEEALGTHGAEWLCRHAADAVNSDYVITESGGFPMGGADGTTRLPVITGEKGVYWCVLTVKGTPGHGSQPLRTDNALVKAAELVRRIDEYRPQAQLHEAWTRFVEGIGFPPELAEPLLDPDRIDAFCDELPLVGLARQAHACTHTTLAPTIMEAGTKVNVIPDRVELTVDIRSLPGWDAADVRAMLDDVIGDLSDDVEVDFRAGDPATTSPIDTPLWDALERVSRVFYPGARTVPFMTVGATDARFHRALGSVAYGFGLHSRAIGFEEYGTMFHGIDERVDVESLRLSTEMWIALAHDFLV